jgi:hypothetical protein
VSAEVDWVLSQLDSAVDAVGAPLERVNRDESQLLDGDIRSRTGELRESNFVGATLADVSNDPIGTEFDYDREAVVGIRIEGLHESEFGHVDPDGGDGVPWDTLVQAIRSALLSTRTFPDAGRDGVSYTDLRTANDAPQSDDYADYYRRDFDVLFLGYEELP